MSVGWGTMTDNKHFKDEWQDKVYTEKQKYVETHWRVPTENLYYYERIKVKQGHSQNIRLYSDCATTLSEYMYNGYPISIVNASYKQISFIPKFCNRLDAHAEFEFRFF